jgi:hypothetical protein
MMNVIKFLVCVLFQSNRQESTAKMDEIPVVVAAFSDLKQVFAKIHTDKFKRVGRQFSATSDSTYDGRYNRAVLIYSLLLPDKLLTNKRAPT